MKRMLLSTLALAGLALASFTLPSNPAVAQPALGVDCSHLSGTPQMCIKNLTPWPIVGIIASPTSSYGSSWIGIPGGSIPPGQLRVVTFNTGLWGTHCMQYVTVRTASGTVHQYAPMDVCRRSTITVQGW